MYANGRGVAQDNGRASALYQRACDGGDKPGCVSLGFMFEFGRGVSQDESRALALYQGACVDNIVVGCTNLGLMYANGRSVAKDEGRAVTLYRRACDGRIVGGCANLGFMYENGRGVERNLDRALALYQSACDSHNAFGCQVLGSMYASGRGVARDDARAASFYQQSCDAGGATACTNLGVIYASGRGVPADESRALALYQRGCEAGDTNGCTNLSGMYARGHRMLPNDGGQAAQVRPLPAPPVAAGPPPPLGSRPPVPGTAGTSVSTGTAFVVAANGLLLTAYHVVDGAAAVAVRCPGGKAYPVSVNAKAPLVDLAVLEAKNVVFPDYLPLALDTKPVLGARVFTVGFPAPGVLGLEPKFTEGTISSLSGLKGDASFLQISVPIQPGNSGGALLDESGRALGVVVSAAAPAAFLKNTGTLPQNISWAVKINFATPLLSQRPGTQAPSHAATIDRDHVIARATAASCVVVAMRAAAPTPVRQSVNVEGEGRGVMAGVEGGVIGGPAPAPPLQPPPPPPPVRVSGDVKPPEKLKDVKPIYPDVARAARIQGAVALEVVIDPTGGVRDAKVVRSIPLLDQAAIDAVKQWQFTPTLLNGRAVPVMLTVTVNFALQ